MWRAGPGERGHEKVVCPSGQRTILIFVGFNPKREVCDGGLKPYY